MKHENKNTSWSEKFQMSVYHSIPFASLRDSTSCEAAFVIMVVMMLGFRCYVFLYIWFLFILIVWMQIVCKLIKLIKDVILFRLSTVLCAI